MPHRYFTTEISDGTATLRGADAHHLARVMRARLGDTVILCDGNAVEYTATITGFGDECVEFRVEPGYPSAAEPSVEVTLLAGYPKQDKLEQELMKFDEDNNKFHPCFPVSKLRVCLTWQNAKDKGLID